MQIYLPVKEIVIDIHDAILGVSGGRPGILYTRKIEAAVNRPKTYLMYHENCNLHVVCAVLLDSIARNHAFAGGNKRTGLMTAILTYELNDIALQHSADRTKDFENLVLWVVKQKPTIPDIATKLEVLIDKYQISGVSKFIDRLRNLIPPFSTDD